jgi:glc operon protein GlcG
MEYGTSISLEQASHVASAAIAKAAAIDAGSVVAVVDAGGHLMVLLRRDHTQFGSIRVAEAKAHAAVAFKRPTKVFEDSLAQTPRILAIPEATPINGGLPLLHEGRIVGGIGAAGATPQQDGDVAGAGAAAFSKLSPQNGLG